MHGTPLYGHVGIAKAKKSMCKSSFGGQSCSLISSITLSAVPHAKSTQKPGGTLQPLPVPLETWQVVNMDFIMALPHTLRGHTALLVVVDKLSKMTHLIPITQNDALDSNHGTEYAINNSYQESIKTTHFLLNSFKDPPTPLSLNRNATVPAATTFVDQRLQNLKDAKVALEAARQRQKRYADEKRREVSFNVGDKVLLSSRNIRLLNPGTPKLLPKWLGPFTIINYCGRHKEAPEDKDENPDYGASHAVAYKLELLDNMRMHNVFHVSLLEPYRRDGRVQPPPAPIVVDESICRGVVYC
eukprot:1145232-Pelagomonas_calceolata.AAC.3